jgi:predicted ATPase
VVLKKTRPITLDGPVFFDQGLMSVAAYAELIQLPRCH